MSDDDDTAEDGQRERGVFDVDEDRAFDAFTLAWGDAYDEFWHDASGWGAHRKDAGDDEVLTGDTPDELNAAIRADWAREGTL